MTKNDPVEVREVESHDIKDETAVYSCKSFFVLSS